MQTPATKKTRTDSDSEPLHVPSLSRPRFPSPASFASSPNTIGNKDSQFSEFSYNPQSTFGHFGELPSNPKVGEDPLPPFPYGCGFCNQGTICVCQEIAVQDIGNRPLGSNDFKPHGLEDVRLLDTSPDEVNIQKPENSSTSILDNLPSYQPPVHLHRRPGGALVNSVFPVARISPSKSGTMPDMSCSGDPSNCPACAGDDFGKAFC
jgi:hypothetical protein